MKQQFLLLSLLLLFVACKDNASNDPFPKTKMIKHTKVFNDNEPIFRGADMLHFESDNSLVVNVFKDDDYHLLKVNVNYNSTTYMIPFGNGPGEFVNIDIVQPTSDSTFIFRDWNTAQLYKMNVMTGAIKKDYDFDDGRCMKVVKIKDYQILVYDWDGNEVMRYQTDVDLKSICVNKAENIIYAVSFNPDPEIVFFEL